MLEIDRSNSDLQSKGVKITIVKMWMQHSDVSFQLGISNTGEPTTLFDWLLTVQPKSDVSPSSYKMRHFQTNKQVARGRMHDWETLEHEPIESGGRRIGHINFTVEGVPPAERFNIKGAIFDIEVSDINGRRIRVNHVLDSPCPE